MTRAALFALLSLTACGRTDLVETVTATPPAPAAGGTPAEYARVVFKNADCPTTGEERDLIPEAGERLTVVRFRAVEECSRAGGDWFLGHDVGGTNDLLMGQHACWFFSDDLRNTAEQIRYGLVRATQNAGLISAPNGWCLTEEDGGGEPLTTDRRVIAWGLYSSEAAATAARARLTSR